MFGEILFYCIFYGIPLFVLGYFFVSLFQYLHARAANKKKPYSFAENVVKARKVRFIVSAIITAIFFAVVIVFTILLYIAIANM